MDRETSVQNRSVALPFWLTSRRIELYSSPQNPNLAHNSSGSHVSRIALRSNVLFRNRSKVPSSRLISSRTLPLYFRESFAVRLKPHPPQSEVRRRPESTTAMGRNARGSCETASPSVYRASRRPSHVQFDGYSVVSPEVSFKGTRPEKGENLVRGEWAL